MAGYIGSKAVLLSTTAATVTGAADIGGDLTVDTNTLYVDSTNNRVGVGTSSPSDTLQVNGYTRLYGTIPTLRFHETDGTADENYQIRLTGGELQFQTNNDAFDAASAKMTLDSSGKLLVGQSSGTSQIAVTSPAVLTPVYSYAGSGGYGRVMWMGRDTVTPSTGSTVFKLGQTGLTSPRSALFEFCLNGRYGNNGASYHSALQFQVFVQFSSTGTCYLRSGGENGTKYIWDYATDVSFTNLGNSEFTITVANRPYVNAIEWNVERKASSTGAGLIDVTYN